MDRPLVSIVLPCYNIASRFYLFEQALCAIARQTYNNFEVIVIDDGSADDTSARVSAYIEKDGGQHSIHYHRLPQNSGTSVARNAGIKAARGEIISFLDFDDLYLPRYLEAAVSAFSDPAVQTVLIASLFYKTLLGQVKVTASEIPADINTRPFEEACALYLSSNFPIAMGSGVACRRKMFETHPNTYYDEFLSKRTAEDVMFGYRLLLEGIRPHLILEPLVIHRTFFGQLSRSSGAFFKQDELETYEYIYQHTMGPLLERIRGQVPKYVPQIEAAVARSRGEFGVKRCFLRGEWSALCQMACGNIRHAKTALRLMLLRLLSVRPLTLVRDCYFYWRSESDETAKQRALECIRAVEAS